MSLLGKLRNKAENLPNLRPPRNPSPHDRNPKTSRTILSRSRLDLENMSHTASHRDHRAVLEDLKANEEPQEIPVRQRPPARRPPPPRDQGIFGWQFVNTLRDGAPFSLLRYVTSGVWPIWHTLEFEFDYDDRLKDGFMALSPTGTILVQYNKKGLLNEWFFYTLHLVHHLAFGYLRPPESCSEPDLWRLACEILINNQAGGPLFAQPEGFPRFSTFRFGLLSNSIRAVTPEKMMAVLKQSSNLPNYENWRSPAGIRTWDVLDTPREAVSQYRSMYMLHQVRLLQPQLDHQRKYATSLIARAFEWVEQNFPLLSAVTAEFKIDYESATKLNIAIGAVSAQNHTIYVNPEAELSEMEWRWVLVHEILHVVLEHHKRLHQRDPLLWNVACDYVINNWLEQMGVGMRPQGTLYKESYKGRDAESIYDELIQNGGNEQLKLVSFRGEGVGDMLDFDPNFRADSRPPTSIFRRNGVRQMAQNAAKKMLEDQSNGIGRGTLPGDLIEELGLKPDLGEQVQAPEWKADLAEWFNVQFLPKPPRRSYNRMSRRQSAVPNIPLPGRAMIDFESPTFGVVLDTSGSMSHELLQLGLAAVVAFSGRHGVTHLRLVMCDTRPYDEGFIPLPTLKKPYQIRGRGGTILQPAITLLEAAKDFPDNAPILIVTDGAIDILEVEREHAYLLPGNGSLPFEPKGPVFTILGETRSSPFRRRFTTPAQK